MCIYSQPSSKEARAAEREMERFMREENKRERMLAKQARLCAQYEALPLYLEVAAIYLLFSTVLTWLQGIGEKRLASFGMERG